MIDNKLVPLLEWKILPATLIPQKTMTNSSIVYVCLWVGYEYGNIYMFCDWPMTMTTFPSQTTVIYMLSCSCLITCTRHLASTRVWIYPNCLLQHKSRAITHTHHMYIYQPKESKVLISLFIPRKPYFQSNLYVVSRKYYLSRKAAEWAKKVLHDDSSTGRAYRL